MVEKLLTIKKSKKPIYQTLEFLIIFKHVFAQRKLVIRDYARDGEK